MGCVYEFRWAKSRKKSELAPEYERYCLNNIVSFRIYLDSLSDQIQIYSVSYINIMAYRPPHGPTFKPSSHPNVANCPSHLTLQPSIFNMFIDHHPSLQSKNSKCEGYTLSISQESYFPTLQTSIDSLSLSQNSRLVQLQEEEILLQGYIPMLQTSFSPFKSVNFRSSEDMQNLLSKLKCLTLFKRIERFLNKHSQAIAFLQKYPSQQVSKQVREFCLGNNIGYRSQEFMQLVETLQCFPQGWGESILAGRQKNIQKHSQPIEYPSIFTK